MTDAELEQEVKDSIEKMTQSIIVNATGPMLAAGMSESAVVKMCHEVAKQYITGMVARYKEPLIPT